MNLAFYGTLRDPDILAIVTGEDLVSHYVASLSVQGWACLKIKDEAYPLLRSDPRSSTIFHLYHDCSEVSWRRLVAYEGREYGWTEIAIAGHNYRVFMADPSLASSDEPWDLSTFQVRDKELYQIEIEAFRI